MRRLSSSAINHELNSCQNKGSCNQYPPWAAFNAYGDQTTASECWKCWLRSSLQRVCRDIRLQRHWSKRDLLPLVHCPGLTECIRYIWDSNRSYTSYLWHCQNCADQIFCSHGKYILLPASLSSRKTKKKWRDSCRACHKTANNSENGLQWFQCRNSKWFIYDHIIDSCTLKHLFVHRCFDLQGRAISGSYLFDESIVSVKSSIVFRVSHFCVPGTERQAAEMTHERSDSDKACMLSRKWSCMTLCSLSAALCMVMSSLMFFVPFTPAMTLWTMYWSTSDADLRAKFRHLYLNKLVCIENAVLIKRTVVIWYSRLWQILTSSYYV